MFGANPGRGHDYDMASGSSGEETLLSSGDVLLSTPKSMLGFPTPQGAAQLTAVANRRFLPPPGGIHQETAPQTPRSQAHGLHTFDGTLARSRFVQIVRGGTE